MLHTRVREGDYTSFIYDSIAAGKYAEVVEFLRPKAELAPMSQAIHSVLGWCYVALQDFVNAADAYERLTTIMPENTSYWICYVQCLGKAGFPSEAMKILNSISSRIEPVVLLTLRAAIRFQEDETRECKNLLEKISNSTPTVHHNQGCAFFQDKEYSDAAAKFSHALALGGFRAKTAYALAVCYYEMNDIRQAVKYCNDVIGKALSNNPELAPQPRVDGEAMKFIRNSPALQSSFLIEAYNLRAAIEHRSGNLLLAKDELKNIPNRYDEDVDLVTLHNKAILDSEADPEESIQMLSHVVSQPIFPKEALLNLITLYLKEQHYEVAADFMAENIEICYTQLSEDAYSFFEACIILQTSPEEAYLRFEQLISRYQDQLRKLSNQEKLRRKENALDKVKAVESEFDQVILKLQAAVMSQALMYWERKNFVQVEKQLKRCHEFLSDQATWRTNMAHALFMMENYQEAAKFYETITRNQLTDLLKVSPILLANLCVSYIMISRNEEAEDILRRVEEAEERNKRSPVPDGASAVESSSSLCLINLVVGTLYCSKGNYQFGISRILRSFEPSVAQKLDKESWSYAKPVILAALHKISQHEFNIEPGVIQECIEFLRQCEDVGKMMPLDNVLGLAKPTTVGAEARILRKLFLNYAVK
ncbi:tetratricopeptide repeat protein 30A-like isoform X1 [Paramacrobiotus metropolitanus]|nr:tetratricopeptide repeat protein 30A-like isoform X1 [Paramacrobiotus metropolitanus]